MVPFAWTIAALISVLAADFLWAAYRDWRGRRLAVKKGRTLTAKFTLPFR